MRKKILHIGKCDKFLPPFIEFVKENFDISRHEFLLKSGMADKELIPAPSVSLAKRSARSKFKHYSQSLVKMHQAEKIILHSLLDIKIVVILFLAPWLLKKSYWIIWGGDLYEYKHGRRDFGWKLREYFRRPVIRSMGNLVAYVTGEYDLACDWYGAKGKHFRCFTYPSNVFAPISTEPEKKEYTTILVGNSGFSSNHHEEIFEIIRPYRNEDIKIFVPLTYGDRDYSRSVEIIGRDIFGDKFIAMKKHMPKDKYLEFLNGVDIAAFGHNRQQGLGTIRALLGMGKKVYMRQDLTSSRCLAEDGIKTFGLHEFNLNRDFDERENNKLAINKIYNKKRLIKCLDEIFD
jgi:hypothetical protein